MKKNKREVTENQKEDKKSFRKMMIFLLISMVVGFICGFAAEYFKDLQIAESGILMQTLDMATPFCSLFFTVIILLLSIVFERRCHRSFAKWDGEDEQIYEKMDLENGYVMILNSMNMILSYFFFGAGIYCISDESLHQGFTIVRTAAAFAGIILTFIVVGVFQKRSVDFQKKLNPEKRGSVYDSRFAEKWLKSCDEAEKLSIYRCSYKSFKATSGICVLLWLVCFIGMNSWNFGLLPMTMVVIIWAVQTFSYFMESIRLCKHPEIVMK